MRGREVRERRAERDVVAIDAVAERGLDAAEHAGCCLQRDVDHIVGEATAVRAEAIALGSSARIAMRRSLAPAPSGMAKPISAS